LLTDRQTDRPTNRQRGLQKLLPELKNGGGSEIKYRFYEKTMVSKIVLMERSSLPIKTKIQILVQEIVRRRRNTYPGEETEVVEEILGRFMMKLKMSGYSRHHRWEILKSGTRKFKRMLQDEREGKRRLNRPRWEGRTWEVLGQNHEKEKLVRKKENRNRQ